SKPASRKPRRETNRCAPCALAGAAIAACNGVSRLPIALLTLLWVSSAVRNDDRKRTSSSATGSSVVPTRTTVAAERSERESQRLNDRTCVHPGSDAAASASKPNRSSPLRSATTDG